MASHRKAMARHARFSPLRRFSRGLPLASVLVLAAAGAAFVGWRLRDRTFSRSSQAIPHAALQGHNLLLVTIDTLRADRLGCYESRAGLTPALDRLAKEGIRLEKVYAHAPLTFPSHTSILTGQYPTTHGVHDNGTFHVKPSQATLATVLKEAGYRTAAFVGSFVLDARFGLNRGFDLYDDYYGEKRPFASFATAERRAETVVSPAQLWIQQSSASPWFAWVHLWDPHTPYEPPPAFQSSHPNDPYGAEVAYVDHTLGVFLERLRSAGRLARTLVVVTADHGESLGDHGEKTHGTFAYNSTLAVPWLMWAAGTIRPQVFSDPARHIDLLPTVLDLLGVDSPADIEGQSLRPFLSRERSYDPPSIYFEALNTHLTRNWAPLTGVVQQGFKLIDLPIPELYDLRRDPAERENLYEQRRSTAGQLRSELEALTRDSGSPQPERPDPETIERLKSLGYTSSPVVARKSRYGPADDPKRLISLSNAYEEAAESFSKGETDRALAILRELVQKQGDSSQAHQELAYVLHQTGQLPAAIRVLEEAARSGVRDVSLLGLLGAYLLEAGDLDRSVELLEDVVRRDRFYAEAHNYLGVIYSRLGRQAEARAEFEALLALDPSSASAYNNLGSLELELGQIDKAAGYFKKALEFDPELAAAHNGLGVAYARAGQTALSIESWRRAVELNPQQYEALYNLGVALADGSPREAAPYLARFARTAPPDRYGRDIAKTRELLRRIEADVAR